MKKSINAWSVSEKLSFEEMFAELSRLDYDAVELNVDGADHSAHSLTLDTNRDTLETIRGLSEKYQLPVCSISSSLFGADTLGADDEAGRAVGRSVLRKQLECANFLGADGILVVPGGIGPNRSIARAYENSFATLSSLKAEIADGTVKVGLENVWNNFFASPVDMRNFIDALDCPNIGAYFDVGNVVIFSYPEYWIEILGKRIVKVHVKDFLRTGWNAGEFADLLKGSVDWEKVIPALRKAGYDGFLTAEVSSTPADTKLALDQICAL